MLAPWSQVFGATGAFATTSKYKYVYHPDLCHLTLKDAHFTPVVKSTLHCEFTFRKGRHSLRQSQQKRGFPIEYDIATSKMPARVGNQMLHRNTEQPWK